MVSELGDDWGLGQNWMRNRMMNRMIKMMSEVGHDWRLGQGLTEVTQLVIVQRVARNIQRTGIIISGW